MDHNTFKSKIEAFYRVEFPVFYPRIYPPFGSKVHGFMWIYMKWRAP